MSIGEIIFCIYLATGFCVMIYDWYKYQKPIYDQAKKSGMTEDSMAVMYMAFVALAWPLRICSWIFK